MTNNLYPAPKAAIDKTGTATFCRIGLCESDPRGRSTRMRSSHRKQGVFPVLPNSPLLPDPGEPRCRPADPPAALGTVSCVPSGT